MMAAALLTQQDIRIVWDGQRISLKDLNETFELSTIRTDILARLEATVEVFQAVHTP